MRKGASSLPTDVILKVAMALLAGLLLIGVSAPVLESLGINGICTLLSGVFSTLADQVSFSLC